MEFETREPQLQAVTVRLIGETEQLTGRNVILVTDHQPGSMARASYRASISDANTDVIAIARGESPFIDHLIAHELGHVRHFETVPFEHRRLPALTSFGVREFANFLWGDRVAQAAASMGEPTLHAAAQAWASGLSAQLANTPADIDIERRLAGESAIRPLQERSVRNQIQREIHVLSPGVQRNTPAAVWRASAAMIYALHSAVAKEFDVRNLLRPWDAHPAAKRSGELLCEIFESAKPHTLDDFYQVSTRWNEALRLPPLYELRPLAAIRQKDSR
ncbi:MAG: hypothetical protein AB7N24_15415 [Dehalococcoidia bacterium]